MPELIRMQGITKRYLTTIALDKVDFHLEEGEIVSLLGENGAGKTTLMRILYGMTHPDEGCIYFKNEEIKLKSPIDAISRSICMVHQHFMLIPAFTITENIVVGSEPRRFQFFDLQKARREVIRLIDQFHFNINPDEKVESLSVGEQQRVEILKALYRKADVIILDEPTGILTPLEVDELFVILRKLREEGCSIVIITHKLRETKALADRIVVLRDGRLIADDIRPEDISIEQLSEMMVGRQIELNTRQPAGNICEPCLRIRDLVVIENEKAVVDHVSFDVHRGEILGIAGVEGNGQTQLIESLTGLRRPEHMELLLNGEAVDGEAHDFISSGIGHIPEDRIAYGLVKDLSIRDNLILGYHRAPDLCTSKILLKLGAIQEYTSRIADEYMIKTPSVELAAGSLSGGNQQKIIIARVFSRSPDAMVIAHPTRGVDVGAMEFIHQRLFEMRDSGKAILLISADLDEVRKLSDRILVLYEGRIVSESLPGEFTEVELGCLMTGNSLDEIKSGSNSLPVLTDPAPVSLPVETEVSSSAGNADMPAGTVTETPESASAHVAAEKPAPAPKALNAAEASHPAGGKLPGVAAQSLRNAFVTSFFALLFSVVLSAVILKLSGYRPLECYRLIFGISLGTIKGIALSLSQATPLMFTGLSFAIAYRVRMINTGAEGQLYMGAMAAALVGGYISLPGFIHLPMAMLAAFAAGGLTALLVAFLKVKFGASEIILTLMLNNILILFTGYLANTPLKPPDSSLAQTRMVMNTARLDRLIPQTQLTTAIILIILIAVVLQFILSHTAYGYEIKITGLNLKAALTAGIRVNRVYLSTFFISGAIAGLGGAAMVLGVNYRFIAGFSANLGFAGISVAALAAYNPVLVILTAFLFGVLKAGAITLNRTTPVPVEFVDVIQVLVVIFVAAPMLIRAILDAGGRVWRKASGKR
jgi:simple sugar transport system ATP-binding protein